MFYDHHEVIWLRFPLQSLLINSRNSQLLQRVLNIMKIQQIFLLDISASYCSIDTYDTVLESQGSMLLLKFKKILILDPFWSMLCLRTSEIFERNRGMLPQIHHIEIVNDIECLWYFVFCKIKTFTFSTPFKLSDLHWKSMQDRNYKICS